MYEHSIYNIIKCTELYLYCISADAGTKHVVDYRTFTNAVFLCVLPLHDVLLVVFYLI